MISKKEYTLQIKKKLVVRVTSHNVFQADKVAKNDSQIIGLTLLL